MANSHKPSALNHPDWRPDGCPVEEPFRLISGQIHASVTHRSAESIVPVRAVNEIDLIEIHRIRHLSQKVILTSHIVRDILIQELIIAFDRRCIWKSD